ncbi:MAG TPA: YqgE/AlgH family protein [Dokdonella sp.]|jgi:putative transcriptional regulator|nr:YqgE/AlgH family protein [Dokdonella sp.]
MVAMHESSTLSNQLLIAMPSLRDPNFARGVALVCQHGEDGAMGIMINRLSDYRLGDVLAQMNLRSDLPDVIDSPVLVGGPVQPERGFVLHTPHGGWDSSFRISDFISVTTSRDILAAIAAGNGPQDAIVALGYSGWSPGQIEHEMRENAWLTAPVDNAILFRTPLDERWRASAALVGVNLEQISPYAGNA